MKRMALAVALLVGLACLALRPSDAPAQSSEWESYRYAGIHAHLRGDYAEAEPLYRRSLALAEKALGPDHPDVAQSLENYAALLRETGRGAEATELEARAEAIRAKHAKEKPKHRKSVPILAPPNGGICAASRRFIN